ncbi:MAG: tetratricopeptide repeat protein [Candidatus Omnitrophota bacterium]
MRISVRAKKCVTILSVTCLLIAGAGHVSGANDTVPPDQLDFADGLFERGLYDMARDEYKKFIDMYPASIHCPDACFGAAESLFFLKRYDEAIEEYNNYAGLYPDGDKVPVAVLRVGQAYFMEGNARDAVKYLNKVPMHRLDARFGPMLYFYRARAYEALGNRGMMKKNFEAAAGGEGRDEYRALALLELGHMSREGAKSDAAVGYYSEAYECSDDPSTKAFALHKKGEAQFEAAEYGAAEASFREVLEKYPENDVSGNAVANLLLALYEEDKFTEVISAYAKYGSSARSGEDAFDALYVVASAHEETGNYAEALAKLEEVLAAGGISDARRHKAVMKKAETLGHAGRFDDALALLDSELKASDSDIDHMIFMKAEADYCIAAYDESAQAYKKVIDEYPSSDYRDSCLYGVCFALKAAGDDKAAAGAFLDYFSSGGDEEKRKEALYNAILIDTKLGRAREAIKNSRTYLGKFRSGSLREKVLFRLGLLYSGMKDYYNATDTFRRFIQQYGGSGHLNNAYFQLGYNLQLAGKTDEALVSYGNITDKADMDTRYFGLKNTALIYLDRDDNRKAAEAFDRIITEFPGNDLDAGVYLWLAKFYLDGSKFTDTLRVLDACAGRKDMDGASRAEAAYFSGEAYRGMKDYGKAAECYDEAMRGGGDAVLKGASRIGRGLCLIESGDLDGAKSEFDAALLENADDNTVTMRSRFELARIAELNDDDDEAYKMYMLVAILYDDAYYCPESLLRAGALFESSGKTNEARKAYDEIIKKYPSSDAAKEAQKRIEGLAKG